MEFSHLKWQEQRGNTMIMSEAQGSKHPTTPKGHKAIKMSVETMKGAGEAQHSFNEDKHLACL